MLKSKWFWVYIAITVFVGYVSGGGLLGAVWMPLLFPGAFLNLIVSPHGVNNAGLIAGGSLMYWLLMYIRFKYFTPGAAPASQAIVLERRHSIETEDY